MTEHPDRTKWMDEFEASCEELGVTLLHIRGGLRALRMDTADFFEVCLQSGPLSVWVALHESTTRLLDPEYVAQVVTSPHYSTAGSVSDWHWARQGVGTEREEE